MEIAEIAFINPLIPPVLGTIPHPLCPPLLVRKGGLSFLDEGAGHAPSQTLPLKGDQKVIVLPPPDSRQEESCTSFSLHPKIPLTPPFSKRDAGCAKSQVRSAEILRVERGIKGMRTISDIVLK
jgi:hypothetical protein